MTVSPAPQQAGRAQPALSGGQARIS
jgi:hypothetical protein